MSQQKHINPNQDFLIHQQKYRILQATDDFNYQLLRAKDSFDYPKALEEIGAKAVGMYHFYARSVNLINWIYGHPAFLTTLKQHIKSGYRDKLIHPSGINLSRAFNALQIASGELFAVIEDLLSTGNAGKGRWINNVSYYNLTTMDLLKTIINSKPEQYWTDMYEEGFKGSAILEEYTLSKKHN